MSTPQRNFAGRAARLLRRGRPRHRDRRARAAQVWRAHLRAPRNRAQHLRGQRPQGRAARSSSKSLAEVPPGATLVFSRPRREPGRAARGRCAGAFSIFDATCPLVTKVHVEVAKLAKEGYEFIMIGHKGHPEVEGTMGQLLRGHLPGRRRGRRRHACSRAKREKLAVVTQTTLSVDDAAGILAAIRAALSAGARAQAAGHLLRHAEPPGCGQATGRAGGRGHRRGQPHQQQQQPPARAGRAPGHARLHGR